MAYGEESWISLPMSGPGNSVVSTDWGTLGYKCATGSAGEFFAEFACAYPRLKIRRLGMLVTQAFTASCVIKVWKNGTSGTLLATFTMAATAIGKFVYIDPTTAAKTNMDAGDYIQFELDVADTTTGLVFPVVMIEPVPETAANISDMDTSVAA